MAMMKRCDHKMIRQHVVRMDLFLPAVRLLVVACMLLGPFKAEADPRQNSKTSEPLIVFAAASLKTAFDRVAKDWQAKSGQKVRISYAGSARLARQISQGAPADLFISANQAWMDVLDRQQLLQKDTRIVLLGNELVLATAQAGETETRKAGLVLSSKLDLAGLLGKERLAMALVKSVPAGIYGRQALQHYDLWQSVAGKVAQTDNARTTLALIARGEVPYGIVYLSDVKADKRVRIAARFPADTHDPILYPAAITKESRHAGARDFLQYLQSASAIARFLAEGFSRVRN